MRTHQQIIKDHGALRLSRDLAERGIKVHFSTPQRWSERSSIPGEYWAAIVDMGLATLEELASAADARAQGEAA